MNQSHHLLRTFFSISLTFTLTPPLGTVSQGRMKSGSGVQKKQPLWNPERRQHCSPCSLSPSKCGTNEITAETMQKKGDPTDREGKDMSRVNPWTNRDDHEVKSVCLLTCFPFSTELGRVQSFLMDEWVRRLKNPVIFTSGGYVASFVSENSSIAWAHLKKKKS